MQRFRVNEPSVVFETFDQEIVLVNLDTGNYYTVRGTGPRIWMALAAGASLGEIAEAMSVGHGGDGTAIAPVVTEFAAKLIDAQLIVPDAGAKAGERPPVAPGNAAFEEPILESYADMQDLLMLDPIHDVDAAGWPLAKED